MKPLLGRKRISFDEAAERLDITRRCLFMWVAAYKFPRPYKVGGKNFYFEDEFNLAVNAMLSAEQEHV